MQQGQLYKRAAFISKFFKFFDTLIIAIMCVALYYLKFGKLPPENYQLFILVFLLLTINCFSWVSVYGTWRGHSLFKEISKITLAYCLSLLLLGALMFLTKSGHDFSRLWVGWTFLATYVALLGYRFVIRAILRYSRRAGINQKRVIIVGAGALGKRACRAMITEAWAGLKPVGFVDDSDTLVGTDYNNVNVIGRINELANTIEKLRRSGEPIDQVWIALPLSNHKRIEEIQLALQNTATNVFFMPDLFGFNLASYKVDEIVGLPVMNMSAKNLHGMSAVVKRIEDVVVSAMMLLILSPVMMAIAVLIKRESPGPVFFKQRRYGQDGQEILVWKFRSMSVTEDGATVTQATRNDSRITKIGAILRKSSLDELPQLINVLQGTMSLVGPRPHAVAHNEHYRTKVTGYMARHQIRPGITGLAQVSGCRGETSDLSEMEERIRYDLEYIRNWSILLDIKILFKTISTVTDFKNTY